MGRAGLNRKDACVLTDAPRLGFGCVMRRKVCADYVCFDMRLAPPTLKCLQMSDTSPVTRKDLKRTRWTDLILAGPAKPPC